MQRAAKQCSVFVGRQMKTPATTQTSPMREYLPPALRQRKIKWAACLRDCCGGRLAAGVGQLRDVQFPAAASAAVFP
jgi:hypothetical protein